MPSDTLAGVTVTAVACNVAVPLNVTTCGLLFALSVIVSVPVRIPAAVGANATLTVHVAFPTSVAPQPLLATVKSPAATTPEIVKVVARLFFTVTVCAALVVPTACNPNVNPTGNAVACGSTPLPVVVITSGLTPAASTLIATFPFRAPLAVGANVTFIVHAPPAANAVPQLFVCP